MVIKVDKKDEILEATYKHFARRGYNVSMSDIAKEVGIKPPSLYSHFSGKDEIIYLIVEKQVGSYRNFLNRVYEECKDKVVEEKLETIFFEIVKYFQDNDKLRFWRNILLIDQDELRKRCNELMIDLELFQIEKMKEVFGQTLLQADSNQGASNQDEIEGNALLFLAMIQGALEGELLCYGSTSNAGEFIAKTWRAYWKGMRNTMKTE
jgi:AcrR family transcriptional regulator